MSKLSQQLFRQQALDFAKVQEQFDEHLKIATSRGWLILIALLLALFGLLIWGFFGTIPTRVMGQGMIRVTKGAIQQATVLETGGQIKRLLVKPGDSVYMGQVLAQVDNEELNKKVANTRVYLDTLENELLSLHEKAQTEIEKRRHQFKQRNQLMENAIDTEKRNVEQYEELLKLKKDWLSKKESSVIMSNYYNSLKQIELTQERIMQNQSALDDFIDQWHQRSKSLQHTIDKEQLELENLIAILKTNHLVKSPANGVVLHFQKTVGDMVQKGDAILSIAPPESQLEVLAYFPLKDGKLLESGQLALVSPVMIKKEEFGSIKSTITATAAYPSANADLKSQLNNEELIKHINEQGPSYEVVLEMKPESKNSSGFAWTTSLGPNLQLTPGTWVFVMVNVNERSPVSLIMPAFRTLLGKGNPKTLQSQNSHRKI